MTIDGGTLTTILSIGPIAAMIVNYFISVGMDRKDKEKLELEDTKLRALIDKIFTWKDDHTKESSEVRLAFSNQMAKIFANVEVIDHKFLEILRRLDELKNDFHDFKKTQK